MHSMRNQESQNNEISFADILHLGLRYKNWILAGGLVAGLLGALFAWQRPTQWQGSVMLEMGQLDQKTDESMLQVLNKVSMPMFKTAVLSKAEIKSDKERALFQQSLRAENIKGTNFVEIKMNAYTKETAQELITAAARHLQATLDEILLPAVELLKARSQLNLKDLQAIDSDIQNLKRNLEKGGRQTGSDFFVSNMILNDKIRESRIFEVRKLELQAQLSPSRTFLTKIVGDAQAYQMPGKPGRVLIVVISILFGCLSAWALAFIHTFSKPGSIFKKD